jgi:hypothetical protein
MGNTAKIRHRRKRRKHAAAATAAAVAKLMAWVRAGVYDAPPSERPSGLTDLGTQGPDA